MKEIDNCPKCNASLIGDPIPEEHREKYYGGQTHFRREVGYEFPDLYDGVWYWQCPDCGHQWGGVRDLKNDSNLIGKKRK